jgi:hypothetical protein
MNLRLDLSVFMQAVPFESPHRFRVEVLFTPGANYSPFDVDVSEDHVVPIIPRVSKDIVSMHATAF